MICKNPDKSGRTGVASLRGTGRMTGSCGGGWGVPMHGKGVSAYRNRTIAYVRKEATVREGMVASANGKRVISCWKREETCGKGAQSILEEERCM
jgi:hypothetical protein